MGALDLDEEAVHRYLADQIRHRTAKARPRLTLRQLAREAEMSEVTLHRVLSGARSPRLDQIHRLARALRCRPSQLLP